MMGVDLSSVNDWEAYVLIFYQGSEIYVKSHFQIPAGSWQARSEHYGPMTHQWVSEGHVKVIPGMVHNDQARVDMIEDLISRYDVRHIGFDPYNAHKVAKTLADRYGDDLCVAIRQGVLYLNEPMKDIYRRGLEGMLTHCGNPVMEAHLSAVQLMQDKNGNYYMDKSKSTDKIDGPAAMVTAMATLLHFEDTSYYENNDLVFI